MIAGNGGVQRDCEQRRKAVKTEAVRRIREAVAASGLPPKALAELLRTLLQLDLSGKPRP